LIGESGQKRLHEISQQLKVKKVKKQLGTENNQELTDEEVRSSWPIGPRQLIKYRMPSVYRLHYINQP
jgi:hypothetical protein